MAVLLKKWALALTLFGITYSINAQEKTQHSLKTINEFSKELQSQLDHKIGEKSKIKLFVSDKEAFDSSINYLNTDTSGNMHIEGEIPEKVSGSFSITINKEQIAGHILFPHDKKAYSYFSDNKGNAFIKEVDINKIICIDLPKPQTSLIEEKLHHTGKAAVINTSNLQSLSGAAGCILLDFNGHTIPAGSGWNGGNAFTAVPSGMADDQILEAWEIAAEDFRPFNINVTTNENVFNSYPVNKRTRCIITPTDIAAPGNAGIALINSFSGNDLPCWVFTSTAGTCGKIVGEIASHESGHTLGLHHDGKSQEVYYTGHGQWAPIMGAGYYKMVTQWSKAEYSNGTNHEDDLSIISNAVGGLGYRNDNVGDTFATAAPLIITNSQLLETQNNGVIEKTNDIDMFYFDIQGGNISLTVKAAPRHSNLLLKVTLYNNQNTILNTFTASSTDLSLPITIHKYLSSGRYYLAVTGVGEGSPDSGFTSYASLGYYDISGTINNPKSGKTPVHEEIKVYPNPVKDELTIQLGSSNEKYQISILNFQGQKVYTSISSEKKVVIPFHDQHQGIYLVILKNMLTNEEKTFKILKK